MITVTRQSRAYSIIIWSKTHVKPTSVSLEVKVCFWSVPYQGQIGLVAILSCRASWSLQIRMGFPREPSNTTHTHTHSYLHHHSHAVTSGSEGRVLGNRLFSPLSVISLIAGTIQKAHQPHLVFGCTALVNMFFLVQAAPHHNMRWKTKKLRL